VQRDHYPIETSYLRIPEVERLTGLSRSTIYLMMSKGEFPLPYSLGDRAVGWDAAEVGSWLASRVKTRQGASEPRSVRMRQVRAGARKAGGPEKESLQTRGPVRAYVPADLKEAKTSHV
jgi:prophage regulatory protein